MLFMIILVILFCKFCIT